MDHTQPHPALRNPVAPRVGGPRALHLLSPEGDLPDIYRTQARYPANYLIDRQGRLTPAPSTDRPFEELVARVGELLAAPRP